MDPALFLAQPPARAKDRHAGGAAEDAFYAQFDPMWPALRRLFSIRLRRRPRWIARRSARA